MKIGDAIRRSREMHGYSLRSLARALEIAPSYMSDIELNHRTPTERVLRGVSEMLHMDFDFLMHQADRIPERVQHYLLEEELASQIVRKMAEAGFEREDLQTILQVVDETVRQRKEKRAAESTDS